ncbi:putative transcription factor interactor and regulator CCHC(Zn) family [Helianthus annuus]|uniref:Transcription factor interactor and regulator CCHC(Zn) family n=1 Tax=Helianthus annuus TaxID=4232 RepID=A0A9K3GZR9_HELAN|nr:putative transcription factor interactor and regulator CCHC(Zn) family [Helianthus annuus]
MIKKVFKMTEINISEIKDLNLTRKPKKYTSRVQQRLNKKKGYNSGFGFQKKPNHNGSYKKKGLGFVPPENSKNDKISKTNTKFVSGGSAEEEQKKPFRRQSNQEFLAQMKRKGTRVFHRKDTRTCFKCNEAGHIASVCSQMAKSKHGVSEKLKEKVVDIEPLTEQFKIFENSTNEVGECSKKNFYKKKAKDNQVWVVKKDDEKVGDESGSTNPDEPQVEVKEVKSVPSKDEVEIPSLKFEKIKQKVGKVEISNQFYFD